jgi:hypothetical protein
VSFGLECGAMIRDSPAWLGLGLVRMAVRDSGSAKAAHRELQDHYVPSSLGSGLLVNLR